MTFKALFALKSHLRQQLDIGFNRALILVPNRGLRGRTRSATTHESQEVDYEGYDEEMPQMKDREVVGLRQRQYRERPERQEWYDSRRHRPIDVFERAKHDMNMRSEGNGNYGNNYRDLTNNRHLNRNERFERNPNYGNNYRESGNYKNFNQNQNKYQNYNRNENFDQRFNRFERNDNNRYDNKNNRYSDRKQLRDYKDFKNRNEINEFSTENNDIYNTNNDFQFENQRPRFSRFREKETIEMKKSKRNRDLNQNSNEEIIDSKEFEVKETEENEENKGERQSISIPYNVTLENRFEVLNQIVTPLHLKPYDTQLGIKYQKNLDVLRKLGKRLKQIQSPVVCDAKGLPCPLESVKPSPVIERYRNKDEFSVWPGVDGFSKTVGFFIGQPSVHNNVVCVEPNHIIVSRESHLSIASKFQSYLKDISEYDSCQNYGEGGHWRRLHIRSNDEGQHMVTAIMHPQELTQEELDREMNKLREYFKDDQRISSLYFLASKHTRQTHCKDKAPYVLLFGDQTITETLFDKKFEISVDSFFQTNTSAAHVLYRNIISEINPNRNTTVLDICCGTGTLATIIAPEVCRVIGIDSSESAIRDANKNAALNGVKNVTFIAGPVEEVLPKLTDDLYSQNIVVVANPTRAGLHSSVINRLRELNFIKKIVYVSCKPEGESYKNLIHLCLPAGKHSKHSASAPFVPCNAIPVDLFPQTNHCELIITFERF